MATIVDHEDFNVEEDCEKLNEAMKGLGTDEDLITETIAKRSNAQRLEMEKTFGQMFGEKLEDRLKSELGGNYEDCVLAMFKSPTEFDAYELHEAIEGAGTSEKVLIEILCSRTNEEIEEIKKKYKLMFDDASLEEDIENDTSNSFGKLMFSLVQAARSEDEDVNEDEVTVDADALIEAGEAQWGTDESRFNVIFASRSYAHLLRVFEEYETKSEKTMEEAIKGEMSGDVQDAMLAIVKCVRSKSQFYAERLYKSMKGAGTDDRTLIRIIVSRAEVDLADVKEQFQAMYEQTLEDFIADDCGGDYKKILLLICAGNV